MGTTVKALAATDAGGALGAFEYELGELGPHEVDVAVTHCGICHSDLSMLDNEWGMASFPFVPGHEAAGTVAAKGELVTHLEIGQRVGVGWQAGSCMHCRHCVGGDHNLCGEMEGTIVGRHGGFATHVRSKAAFAVPLPEGVGSVGAGPLFCGGITVFNPIVQFGVKPTDRVGVIGIGGLGHMALGFLNKWGCEVTAFTSTGAKMDEAKELGAHRCVNSRDDSAIEAEAGRFDFLISTVNVPLNWEAYIGALSPKGRLHVVGAVMEPIPVTAFPIIMGQKSVSGSPIGSPATIADMLDFCARHAIAPVTETFKMSAANDAFEHLRAGKARYRIVLEQDLA
ncbi:MAG: alcohol dehydrogenase [Phycisphaeraceae bacterium]|nr:MAG: alcohol dehydrogenase [Phycisphaeraceae bacterium]